jgi:hypothetical protein
LGIADADDEAVAKALVEYHRQGVVKVPEILGLLKAELGVDMRYAESLSIKFRFLPHLHNFALPAAAHCSDERANWDYKVPVPLPATSQRQSSANSFSMNCAKIP